MKQILCLNLGRAKPSDEISWTELAEWCRQFSPLVGLEPWGERTSLLVDLTHTAELFGGAPRLAETMVRAIRRGRAAVRAGLAPTVGAAWALAHYGPEHDPGALAGLSSSAAISQAGVSRSRNVGLSPRYKVIDLLAPLPLAALRLSEELLLLLAELGLERIGQLQEVPRGALAARFDPRLLTRLDQLTGEVDEPIAAYEPPPELVVVRDLENPLANREAVGHVIEELLGDVAARLEARRRGALALVCSLQCETGGAMDIGVGLYSPSASAAYLAELVGLRWAGISLPGPVQKIRLAVTATAPLVFSQQALAFAQNPREARGRRVALFLDRLSGRLGRQAVVRPRHCPDAQPEFAFRYEPLVGTGPLVGTRPSRLTASGQQRHVGRRARVGERIRLPQQPLERPLRLFSPVPLEVLSVVPDGPPIRFRSRQIAHRIVRGIGPERIETGWWRGRDIGRDYYRVETETGLWFWLFRDRRTRKWFLHGEFS